MKRADMVVGMEVAVGSGSFPARGVILSPEVLPLVFHYSGFGYRRGPQFGIPSDVNPKTACTVAIDRSGVWTPQHATLAQVRPWAVHEEQERAAEEQCKRDAEKRAQELSDWMRRRDNVADLADRIGWPVEVDTHLIKVDGVYLYDRHRSTDALFPITTVEKLLEQNLATADLLSACERLLVNFHNALRGTPVRDATETIAEAEAAIAKASKEVRP